MPSPGTEDGRRMGPYHVIRTDGGASALVEPVQSFEEFATRVREKLGFGGKDSLRISTFDDIVVDEVLFQSLDTEFLRAAAGEETEESTVLKFVIDTTPHVNILLHAGDEYDFTTALCELIDNSLQATVNNRSAGRIVKIDLDRPSPVSPHGCSLRVWDNGEGMNLDALQQWSTMGMSMEKNEDKRLLSQVAMSQLAQHSTTQVPITQMVVDKYLSSAFSRYGVGSKRAVFNIGDSVLVRSRPPGSPYLYECSMSRKGVEDSAAAAGGRKWSADVRVLPCSSHVSVDPHFTEITIGNVKPVYADQYDAVRMRDQISATYHFYVHGPRGNERGVARLRARRAEPANGSPASDDGDGAAPTTQNGGAVSRGGTIREKMGQNGEMSDEGDADDDEVQGTPAGASQEASAASDHQWPVLARPGPRRGVSASPSQRSLYKPVDIQVDGVSLRQSTHVDYITRCMASAGPDTLDMALRIEADGRRTMVKVTLFYFPFRNSRETMPPRVLFGAGDGSSAPDGEIGGAGGDYRGQRALSQHAPATPGRRRLSQSATPRRRGATNAATASALDAGFEVFWLGRLLPRAFHTPLPFMRMDAARSDKLPPVCYRRVRGFMFLNSEFEVTQNKLDLCKHSPLCAALAQFQTRRHRERYLDWLERCHSSLDEDIVFAEPLPDAGDEERTLYARVRVHGAEFVVGDRVRLRTKPRTFGTITELAEDHNGAFVRIRMCSVSDARDAPESVYAAARLDRVLTEREWRAQQSRLADRVPVRIVVATSLPGSQPSPAKREGEDDGEGATAGPPTDSDFAEVVAGALPPDAFAICVVGGDGHRAPQGGGTLACTVTHSADDDDAPPRASFRVDAEQDGLYHIPLKSHVEAFTSEGDYVLTVAAAKGGLPLEQLRRSWRVVPGEAVALSASPPCRTVVGIGETVPPIKIAKVDKFGNAVPFRKAPQGLRVRCGEKGIKVGAARLKLSRCRQWATLENLRVDVAKIPEDATRTPVTLRISLQGLEGTADVTLEAVAGEPHALVVAEDPVAGDDRSGPLERVVLQLRDACGNAIVPDANPWTLQHLQGVRVVATGEHLRAPKKAPPDDAGLFVFERAIRLRASSRGLGAVEISFATEGTKDTAALSCTVEVPLEGGAEPSALVLSLECEDGDSVQATGGADTDEDLQIVCPCGSELRGIRAALVGWANTASQPPVLETSWCEETVEVDGQGGAVLPALHAPSGVRTTRFEVTCSAFSQRLTASFSVQTQPGPPERFSVVEGACTAIPCGAKFELRFTLLDGMGNVVTTSFDADVVQPMVEVDPCDASGSASLDAETRRLECLDLPSWSLRRSSKGVYTVSRIALAGVAGPIALRVRNRGTATIAAALHRLELLPGPPECVKVNGAFAAEFNVGAGDILPPLRVQLYDDHGNACIDDDIPVSLVVPRGLRLRQVGKGKALRLKTDGGMCEFTGLTVALGRATDVDAGASFDISIEAPGTTESAVVRLHVQTADQEEHAVQQAAVASSSQAVVDSQRRLTSDGMQTGECAPASAAGGTEAAPHAEGEELCDAYSQGAREALARSRAALAAEAARLRSDIARLESEQAQTSSSGEKRAHAESLTSSERERMVDALCSADGSAGDSIADLLAQARDEAVPPAKLLAALDRALIALQEAPRRPAVSGADATVEKACRVRGAAGSGILGTVASLGFVAGDDQLDEQLAATAGRFMSCIVVTGRVAADKVRKRLRDTQGRVQLLPLDNVLPFPGELTEDGLLPLLPPTCAPGEEPVGFRGFAVNLVHLRASQQHLRSTMLWNLFGDSMVFDEYPNGLAFRKRCLDAKKRCPNIIALDGERVEARGVVYAGKNARITTELRFGDLPVEEDPTCLSLQRGRRILVAAIGEHEEGEGEPSSDNEADERLAARLAKLREQLDNVQAQLDQAQPAGEESSPDSLPEKSNSQERKRRGSGADISADERGSAKASGDDSDDTAAASSRRPRRRRRKR